MVLQKVDSNGFPRYALTMDDKELGSSKAVGLQLLT
jgi:hypothetical protein